MQNYFLQIMKTEISQIKLPNIEGSGNNNLRHESQNRTQKVITEKNNSLKVDYANLRAKRLSNRYFYEGETCRKNNERLPCK